MDKSPALPPIQELCDDQLVTLAQDKNEAAFEELMRRNSSHSYRLALSILKDRQDAEDEVQNSYWNIWRRLDQFQRDSKFSTWVCRIVTNQCLMKLRSARRATFFSLDETGDDGKSATLELRDQRPTPESELGASEMSAVLNREIQKLPPLLREVLVLRDLRESPINDVADHLGISVAAAKSRLLRARLELRQRLERQAGWTDCGAATA